MRQASLFVEIHDSGLSVWPQLRSGRPQSIGGLQSMTAL